VSSDEDLRAALKVSYAAVVWSAVAGATSIVIGIGAGSTALVGTGTDVLADMASSIFLIWRFRAELHGRSPSHVAERRAQTVAGSALLIVAIGISVAAAIRLAQGRGASPDAAGLTIAGLSVVVLPVFAVAKYRIAARVPSKALRLDGHITLVGASMAAVTLLGLLATRELKWTAADSIAALIIAAAAGSVAVKELRSAD
jgi:divalent metal cation (Fe/Co/Zn/Cd) transporter